MDISKRLKTLADMIDNINIIADIGTDHGYIPIYLIENNRCTFAIASDINKGPLEKSRKNIEMAGLKDKIECRLGSGMRTIQPGEVDAVVIAGMGGNLIRDIIEADMEVFKSLDYSLLQPVQNPEVLRKYIYKKGFNVIDEKVVFDEGKFYTIIKVSYDKNPRNLDEILYEVGEFISKDKSEESREFILFKLKEYEKILGKINDDSISAIERKKEVNNKILKLREILEL